MIFFQVRRKKLSSFGEKIDEVNFKVYVINWVNLIFTNIFEWVTKITRGIISTENYRKDPIKYLKTSISLNYLDFTNIFVEGFELGALDQLGTKEQS